MCCSDTFYLSNVSHWRRIRDFDETFVKATQMQCLDGNHAEAIRTRDTTSPRATRGPYPSVSQAVAASNVRYVHHPEFDDAVPSYRMIESRPSANGFVCSTRIAKPGLAVYAEP